jgi:mRNA interferase MazF
MMNGMSLAIAERESTLNHNRGSNYGSNTYTPKNDVNRGEIWIVRLDGNEGSEQGGVRPCLVISNQKGNKFGKTVIVAAITSQIQKAKLPTHVMLRAEDHGLSQTSFVMLEQVRTVSKSRLIEKVATLDSFTMRKVADAHMVSCSAMFN